MGCIGAQFLYLVNVVGQIFFVDCFLGWEFTKYGMAAAAFSELDEEERVDPMSKVFPRVTKCTFQKYGPSGTIQNHDAQCVLPINIINEKIYVYVVLVCVPNSAHRRKLYLVDCSYLPGQCQSCN